MPETSDFSWAALFDMDGVLIDNATYHIDAWLQFAHNHGYSLSKTQYLENINGRVSADAMAYLFQRTILSNELHQLTEEKEAIYRDLYRPHLTPVPGLVDFIKSLKAQHVRLAVGTSAPESNVRFTLDELPLRHYFDAVVDASMIQRGKPDPEIYLTAAWRVGVDPARCVVFEDALAGIEAGLRAGMAVVALATTHTREELADTGAAVIVDDFTELMVEQVQELLL